MSDITDEKYVRLTTFTKDGRRKEAPVWIAALGEGKAGFTTELDSWKVKRIRNTPAVELAPSTVRGVVADDAPTTPGTAVVVAGADADPVQAAIKAKYGFTVAMIQVVNKVRAVLRRHTPERGAVVITFD